jgi:hypothetical protein
MGTSNTTKVAKAGEPGRYEVDESGVLVWIPPKPAPEPKPEKPAT